jgi:hypothetical protein
MRTFVGERTFSMGEHSQWNYQNKVLKSLDCKLLRSGNHGIRDKPYN